MTNRTLCKNHVVLQRMRLACVRIHNTHTHRLYREMKKKKKITETLKKIKGQLARDKGRGGGRSGRLCVYPTTGQRKAGLALLQRNLTQPALATKKKKEDFKTPMQACYFEKWLKKKTKIKKQTQLDCWGNWKALPHLSPRWCYLGKLCNRDPAGLRLWLLFFFQNLNKQRRGNHWGNLSRPLKWLTIT